MNKDPIKQFRSWFREAAASGVPLPEACCFSTVSPKGHPEGRMLLLKEAEASGFVVYTNLKSRKAAALKKNPRAALTFYWERLRRQVRVTGRVKAVSEPEADAYFASRPRESRIGAWASEQSAELPSRKLLENRFEFFSKKFAGKDVPRPSFWSGYRIVPDSVEFWIERPKRLHDRFLYRRKNGRWRVTRLYP